MRLLTAIICMHIYLAARAGRGNGQAMDNTVERIYQKAMELGYEKCGIVPVAALDGYRDRLEERMEKAPSSAPFYRRQMRLAQFRDEFPWAKSVVVAVSAYNKYDLPQELRDHIGKSYLTDIRTDANTQEYRRNRTMEASMRDHGLMVAGNSKFGIVGMRWAALQAGLGTIRRNNFFYTESGSWVHLDAWLTDREMERVFKTNIPACGKGCNRCVKACPTGSLSQPYTMNPLKCVSFLTTFGGRDLPNEPLAKSFGNCIYGCDICQDVCPMNRGKWTGGVEFPGLSELASNLTAEGIMRMDDEFYRARVQPKFFYLSPDELWKWQVNVLNFMNNRYEERFQPLITGALDSPYEQVRAMARAVCEERGLRAAAPARR